MNQETNSGTQGTQQEQAVQNKRSRSAGRNRPVLVSSSSNDQATKDQPVEETSEATQPVEEITSTITVEDTRPRRLPKFFSRVGKNENDSAEDADPAAARIARATRSSGGSSASSRAAKDSQPSESKSSTNKVSTNKAAPKAAPATATRQQGGFKPRYMLGIVIYILVAMVIGQSERGLLLSYHLETTLFKIGPVVVTTSTALYLLTLIILLVILARFDLIPRSLGALSGQPPTRSGKPGQSSSGSENTKTPPPTMKQGVKGSDDDLYQEYREQQRYLQRRERKNK